MLDLHSKDELPARLGSAGERVLKVGVKDPPNGYSELSVLKSVGKSVSSVLLPLSGHLRQLTTNHGVWHRALDLAHKKSNTYPEHSLRSRPCQEIDNSTPRMGPGNIAGDCERNGDTSKAMLSFLTLGTLSCGSASTMQLASLTYS